MYEVGALDPQKGVKIDPKIVEKERKKGYRITRADRFLHRTRYFTDSGIIGSKEYVRKNFQRFKGLFQTKNERVPKLVKGLEGVYSMKRLG